MLEPYNYKITATQLKTCSNQNRLLEILADMLNEDSEATQHRQDVLMEIAPEQLYLES